MNETIDSKIGEKKPVGFWNNVCKSATIAFVGLALGGGFGSIVKKAYLESNYVDYLVVDKVENERLWAAVRFYERERAAMEAMRMMRETIAEKDKNKDGVIDCYESGRLPRSY
ncbi:MAG: hypothetical protein QXR48_00480 [Candidatus Woesearchaeota archaeon]